MDKRGDVKCPCQKESVSNECRYTPPPISLKSFNGSRKLSNKKGIKGVARQKIRVASAGDFSFVVLLELIGSLESPPSNLLRATRKPDILVLSEIRG